MTVYATVERAAGARKCIFSLQSMGLEAEKAG